MHKNVERVIGRLATDRRLRIGFGTDPVTILRELGLELTDLEIAALALIDVPALNAFAASLDPRLRKTCLRTGARTTGDGPQAQSLIQKETVR